ncbi:hypothetical protein PCK2_000345 [Pneumocystis canis]|nr:hypothetical protein PCK2_000345 [Pneumocystis canis]
MPVESSHQSCDSSFPLLSSKIGFKIDFSRTNIEECCAQLRTCYRTGLSTHQDVLYRQSIYGRNETVVKHRESLLFSFSKQLTDNFLMLLLLASAFMSLCVGNISDSISIIVVTVAAVPEGLPIIVSVTLALGIYRMANKKVIIKNLPSVETLGSVNVVCCDKTGTLTENYMIVQKIFTLSRNFPIDIPLDSKKPLFTKDKTLKCLLNTANLCNNARKINNQMFIGQSVDVAIMELIERYGYNDNRTMYTRIQEIPFSSNRKWMSITAYPSSMTPSSSVVYVKGSYEEICMKSVSVLEKNAVEIPLTKDIIEKFDKIARDMANEGLRVIALATLHGSSIDERESGSRIHLTCYTRETATLPSQFCAKLRKHLKSKQLTSLEQIGNDRVVYLGFGGKCETMEPLKPQYYLIFEFYAAGNILLTDGDMKILSLLRMVRSGGMHQQFSVGEIYKITSIPQDRQIEEMTKDILLSLISTLKKKYLDQSDESFSEQISLPLTSKKMSKKRKNSKELPLKRLISWELNNYGNSLIEHIIRDADIDPDMKIEEFYRNIESIDLDHLLLSFQKADELIKNCKEGPLIDKFWPGPLTIILSAQNFKISPLVLGKKDTIAVRMPSNPIALALITLFNVPIAAPSANISTKPSSTLASHVYSDFKGKIPIILDGGPCKIGLESTVVNGLVDPPIILRPGSITKEQIKACGSNWENVVVYKSEDKASDITPLAPGMKYKHYSPNAKVVLFESASEDFVVNWVIQNIDVNVEKNTFIGIMRTMHWKRECLLDIFSKWKVIDYYSIITFDNDYNACIDKYFSSLESQKFDIKLKNQEDNAHQRLQVVKDEHQKKISDLQKFQNICIKKAKAIEENLELVDETIKAVNACVLQSMDW